MFHVKHSEAVSIETEPQSAATLFGYRLALARKYADLLANNSDTLGLLGPRELAKLWTRHIMNSAAIAELVTFDATVADIGSGAGLPGIPMAIALPDTHFTLIEPMERRANWLNRVVSELELANVTVLRERAEAVRGRSFDFTTARAVAPLKNLCELCLPLTKEGGKLLAMKGQRAAEEILVLQKSTKRLGIATIEVVSCGLGIVSEPPTVVVVELAKH